MSRDVTEEGKRGDEERRHRGFDRRRQADDGVDIDGDGDGKGREQRAAKRGGHYGGRRHRDQQHHGLGHMELVDLAGVAADPCEPCPAQATQEMADQEIAARLCWVEFGGFGSLDAPRHESDDRVAKQHRQGPDGDLVAQARQPAESRHRKHQQRDCDRADHHGARMQFQEFAVEVEAARLLRKAVARLAHRARHIAVAVRFTAVHNEFIRCVRA